MRTGVDGIAFNIPGTGTQTITLASALPTLSDTPAIEIDGGTQPGSTRNTDPLASNAQIRIQIQGPNDTEEFPAFFVTTPNNTIRGVAIFRIWRKVWFAGPNAHHNTIAGSFIGTNAAASYASSSFIDTSAGGILFDSGAHDNRVGEETLAGRNVLSGNQRSAIQITARTRG